MSRQELAEAVTGYIWRAYGEQDSIDATYVGHLEQGRYRWPGQRRREAFRQVLGVEHDADLGFYITRASTTLTSPAPATGLHPDHVKIHLLNTRPPLDRGRSTRRRAAMASMLTSLASPTGTHQDHVLVAPGGKYFDGSAIEARVYPAIDDGRILALVPGAESDDEFLRQPRRGLVVAVTTSDRPQPYGLDNRHARTRLARSAPGGRLIIPRAYALDELTLGLLWAVANLDEALINDDGLLAEAQSQVAAYESLPGSAVSREFAAGLSTVSRMWLGSEFCAGHILRHLANLHDVPEFWTREQRGEEASTWLLFDHKYQYLSAVAAHFGDANLTRSFCIPAEVVADSPHAERILVLLAAALMESFGITVAVCVEPEYAAVEGFVLDRDRRAIVANWVDADGIWHAGVTTGRQTVRDFGDITAHAQTHSVVAGSTGRHRLQMLADYLELDWGWITRRCSEISAYGCAGVAQPRSRLLSVRGADRACGYLGQAAAWDR
jgi:hypothetical protein